MHLGQLTPCLTVAPAPFKPTALFTHCFGRRYAQLRYGPLYPPYIRYEEKIQQLSQPGDYFKRLTNHTFIAIAIAITITIIQHTLPRQTQCFIIVSFEGSGSTRAAFPDSEDVNEQPLPLVSVSPSPRKFMDAKVLQPLTCRPQCLARYPHNI